ncbi:hypothetical protein KMW28_15165 [Flammeovirga yaeyamensis]|uniref:DUF4369 domain-containing protein n=1 Tax=Flammeovirga yaeyamensis TaxID=367791 RepID=A0AAX1N0I5_9BACT|nr:hypothetical protein [Flammeovirga yaeyamensis]MBB3698652.1 hypothetical protein [Flammeovirga yaeyamensis]NMF34002.1 hypothetical protein [Flammeovirga yaeyamensis]QWG00990.1 hypothetical protein KMW28_15165 [Flammeovirga yaeyamensis]
MKKFNYLLLLITLFATLTNLIAKEKKVLTTTLKGTIVNAASNSFLIANTTRSFEKEFSLNSDGTFEIIVESTTLYDAFVLKVKNSEKEIVYPFYLDQEVIYFDIDPNLDYEDNIVKGGELTNSALHYKSSLLMEKELHQEFSMALKQFLLTGATAWEENVIKDKLNRLPQKIDAWKVAYFKKHLNLASFKYFMELYNNESTIIPEATLNDLLIDFSKKLPKNFHFDTLSKVRNGKSTFTFTRL